MVTMLWKRKNGNLSHLSENWVFYYSQLAKPITISATTFFCIFRTVHKSTFLNGELAHSQESVTIFYKSMNIFIGIHRWTVLEYSSLLKDNRGGFKLMHDSLDNTRKNQKSRTHFHEQKQWQIIGFPYNCKETSQDRCYYWKKPHNKASHLHLFPGKLLVFFGLGC